MKSRLILVVAASALLASCGSQVSSLPSATSSAPADSGTVSSSPIRLYRKWNRLDFGHINPRKRRPQNRLSGLPER